MKRSIVKHVPYLREYQEAHALRLVRSLEYVPTCSNLRLKIILVNFMASHNEVAVRTVYKGLKLSLVIVRI